MVSSGINLRWNKHTFHVDGVLDFTTGHALPGEVFEMKEIGLWQIGVIISYIEGKY